MDKTEDIKLIEYDGNRQNNFTLIRIIFAWSVLYGHSYAIQKMSGIKDPLGILFQGSTWIGDVAVNGFFAISGFLVVASFIKRGFKDYVISRALRIFPALFVCVFISVFILGPMLTNLNPSIYFFKKQTYKYLINSLPFINIEFNLPGLFQNNTRHAVNGSLWTLIVELRCYFLLALAGFLGLLKNRTIANCGILAIFLFGFYFFSEIPFLGIGANIAWPRLSFYFLLGVFFYINRENVILDIKLASLALFLAFSSFGKEWFLYIFPFSFVYLIFYITYSTPFINIDKKIGDISYGLYIYAWPVQQIVASFFPWFKPSGIILLSSIIVIPIAYLSWHYIEKPALTFKQQLLV